MKQNTAAHDKPSELKNQPKHLSNVENEMIKKAWTIEDSLKLYSVTDWGEDYFSINDKGQVCFRLSGTKQHKLLSEQNENKKNHVKSDIAIIDIVDEMKQRGIDMPCVLRIENLLDDRISLINNSFQNAIQLAGYQNEYRGVFPIKVNQQYHVIEEIACYGKRYHHGLEAGSKAELMIAISHLNDLQSLIICNGYKDKEFIELGLYAKAMGMKCFFVIESLSELKLILEQSEKLQIEPLIGARIRLSTSVDGHWSGDSGDGSIFGVSTTTLMKCVDLLREKNMLHCFQLLHSHLGSQIPNIRNIRTGVQEACQFYAGLVAEGAAMGYLDLGGGLAVDYDGSKSNSTHSMNYGIEEYCNNIVETIMETLSTQGIDHPIIVSESGRATVAHSSMLLFNILHVRHQRTAPIALKADDDWDPALVNLLYTYQSLDESNFQECYNDTLYYRDEIRQLFQRGQVNLRARAEAENICMATLENIQKILNNIERIPVEMQDLDKFLADVYYGNFSLFQSLPDMWAIDQILPVMPIHRLDEEPVCNATIADLTCDCDGKISQFSKQGELSDTIKLHPVVEDKEYYMGVFLVGAYQETLGDLHNLFGDTNVVSVHIDENGEISFEREFNGDSISDVLSYVEYNPTQMVEKLRKLAEKAVRDSKISTAMRKQMLDAFRESLQGYTYFER